MKHLIRRLLTILLTISILTQCMPFTALAFSSQKPYISVDAGLDKGLSAVDAGGRGMDVNIDSNVDWEIYVVEGADWISTSCLSGSGAGSFYTIIDELPDTEGASREGWIVVSGEGCDPIYIRVTQGQTNSINISSNRDYLKLIDISDDFAIRYLPDGTIETTIDAFLEVESDTEDHRNSYNRLRDGKYKAVSAAVRGAYALLTEDGTIEMNEVARHYLNFDNDEDFDTYKNWRDIVEIAVGSYGILALNKDGTVEYDCYIPEPTWGTRPEEWRNVISVDYDFHCVGLRDDGRVYYYQNFNPYADSPYEDPDYRFTEMKSWTGIVQLATAWDHVVGLKADGTVVATGDNHCGQCDVDGWTDIVQIATGMCHTVGLRSDGTVVATGEKERYEGSGYNGKTNVSHLKNVQAVYATRHYTVALLEDGHFEVIGDPSMLGDEYADAYKNVVYSVKNWSPVKYTRAGQSENNAEDSVSLEVMLDSESTTDTTISTDNQKNMRIVNCNEWVSLRARPNTSSDRLAKVPLGATVECVDYNYGDFAYVGYNGNYGYILKEYLSAIEPALNNAHTHNFESKYATVFESIDDKYHQGAKFLYFDTCTECGEVKFSEEPVPADRKQPLEHAYENGVCKSRGCEHVCGHEYVVNEDKRVSNTGVYTFTESGHTRVAVNFEQYCKFCGMQGPDFTKTGLDEFGSHWYGDDKYDHNDTHHWLTNVECRGQCGYIRSNKETIHVYDLEGNCSICGYIQLETDNDTIDKSLVEELISTVDLDEFMYPYNDVLEPYMEQRGGLSAYMSTWVYEVTNLSSYLKLEDLSIDARNHVPNILELVDSMDNQYYVDAVNETNAFLDWLLDFKVDSNIKNSNTIIQRLYKEVGDEVISDLTNASTFQLRYMQALDKFIVLLKNTNQNDLKAMINSYNNAANKAMKYDKLISGIGKIGNCLKRFNNALKVINYAVDVKDIFKDYSSNATKLSVLKDSCGDNKSMVEALTYLEDYYTNTVTRGIETGEKWAIDFALKSVGGSTWLIFTTALKFSPASDIASSFMQTYSLSQISEDMKYDLLYEIRELETDTSYEQVEIVRKKCHAWVDIFIMASQKSMKLTASAAQKKDLQICIDLKDDLHEYFDEKLDSI